MLPRWYKLCHRGICLTGERVRDQVIVCRQQLSCMRPRIMTKLFYPAITPSVVLFLTPSEYGHFLCTCREAAKYDYKFIWTKYTRVRPYQRISKPLAFVDDILTTTDPSLLLHNASSKQRMRLLLDCFRRLVKHDVLAKVYQEYMANRHRSRAFDSMVRMECILVSGSRHATSVARRSRR